MTLRISSPRLLWSVGLVSTTCMLAGSLWSSNRYFAGMGAVGLIYLLYRLVRSKGRPLYSSDVTPDVAGVENAGVGSRFRNGAPPSAQPGSGNDSRPLSEPSEATAGEQGMESLVGQMLGQGRCALLLRPQIAANLTEEQFEPALTALRDQMGLIPEGEVTTRPPRPDQDDSSGRRENAPVWVASAYLDRYAVTNRQYFDFVASGGYEQVAIWEPEIWTAILDFVDRTGCPGPRYWQNGRYAPGEEELPVVGVSWYEAAAYARWVGKRLPTDAEWVKAGSWPVTLGPHSRVQRKFPWGDSMEPKRANLWASGAGRIVGVREYPSGVSVGGVYQLVGNVWEWTSGNFGEDDGHLPDEVSAPGMRNIRGGAFDTYFENQATCQFASGELPVSRKHNIGFRCALSVCDLALAPGGPLGVAIDDELSVLEELSV